MSVERGDPGQLDLERPKSLDLLEYFQKIYNNQTVIWQWIQGMNGDLNSLNVRLMELEEQNEQ